MQASQSPSKIPLAFATSGAKNVIPELTSGITNPNDASFQAGFPPITMTPVSAGGIPPNGEDFNGILFAISAISRWTSAGGIFKYDAAFATDAAVNGYPKGAVIESADGSTLWLCVADNNLTDPDSAASANWVSLAAYGIAAVTGLTNTNFTLTPAQSGKSIVTLAGALTGNVQVIFPAHQRQWSIVNNCTGNFTVTVKTALGTGVVIPASTAPQLVYGDGTNINSAISQANETVSGIAKISTQSQTNAGTDDATIVTPKKLRFGFAIQTGTTGYIALPSWLGGFVFQWGQLVINVPAINTTTFGSWTFPIAFPNACFSAWGFQHALGGSGGTSLLERICGGGSPSTTAAGFNVNDSDSAGSYTLRTLSIGN